MTTALITGITGQAGSHLADLLLAEGVRVAGLVRRTSADGVPPRLAHIIDRLEIHSGDLLDECSLIRTLQAVQPDEIYNLAGLSFVPASFAQPVLTLDIVAVGTVRLLEAMRTVVPRARLFQASTSEMFGRVKVSPQNEDTPFHPRSPYGVAKAAAHHAVVNYREAYGLHASCGILFNHEGPRRGLAFVTRRITDAVARIHHGMQQTLTLGNLDARRDWGYAGDYVRAMTLMVRRPTPGDYVVATGVAHTVRDVVEAAFAHVGLDWRAHVQTDAAHLRPAEVDDLCGDATRARRELGWAPAVDFAGLVRLMMEADLDRVARLKAAGRTPPNP